MLIWFCLTFWKLSGGDIFGLSLGMNFVGFPVSFSLMGLKWIWRVYPEIWDFNVDYRDVRYSCFAISTTITLFWVSINLLGNQLWITSLEESLSWGGRLVVDLLGSFIWVIFVIILSRLIFWSFASGDFYTKFIHCSVFFFYNSVQE